MSEWPLVEGFLNPKCSLCEEMATLWWPAYDKELEPRPYCSTCVEKAKETVTLNRNYFVKENHAR